MGGERGTKRGYATVRENEKRLENIRTRGTAGDEIDEHVEFPQVKSGTSTLKVSPKQEISEQVRKTN